MSESDTMSEPALKKRKRDDTTVYGDPKGSTQFRVISQADLNSHMTQVLSSYLATPLTQIVIQYAPPKIDFRTELRNLTNTTKAQYVDEILQYGLDRCRSRAGHGLNTVSISLSVSASNEQGVWTPEGVQLPQGFTEDADFLQILANVFSQAGLIDVTIKKSLGFSRTLRACW